MAWGGQWCASPGYAYVHESIAEAFVAEAKAALIGLFRDDPKSNSAIRASSSVINAREVTRLAGLIDPAKIIKIIIADPCEVDAELAARCRNRPSIPAPYVREERRADAVA